MKYAAILALAVALTACGGGGEEEVELPTPVTSSSVSAAPVLTGTQAVPEAVSMLNIQRIQQRLPALDRDPNLELAAMAHASDMAANGYFAHTSPTGSTPTQRIRASGYAPCVTSENIAKGQRTAEEVMASWTDSEEHRSNMYSPQVEAVGVARGPDNHWVMVLARTCRNNEFLPE